MNKEACVFFTQNEKSEHQFEQDFYIHNNMADFEDYFTRREYLQYREDKRNQKKEKAWRMLHIHRVKNDQKVREPWYRNPIWYTLDSLSDGECVFLMIFVAFIFYLFNFLLV